MQFQFPSIFARLTAYCIPCTLQPHSTLLADQCIRPIVYIFNFTKHIILIHVMTGDIVFRVLNLCSASRMFNSRSLCLHACAYITKQYNLVLVNVL